MKRGTPSVSGRACAHRPFAGRTVTCAGGSTAELTLAGEQSGSDWAVVEWRLRAGARSDLRAASLACDGAVPPRPAVLAADRRRTVAVGQGSPGARGPGDSLMSWLSRRPLRSAG